MTCILIYRIPAFLFTEYSHPYLPKSRILNCRKLALLFTVYIYTKIDKIFKIRIKAQLEGSQIFFKRFLHVEDLVKNEKYFVLIVNKDGIHFSNLRELYLGLKNVIVKELEEIEKKVQDYEFHKRNDLIYDEVFIDYELDGLGYKGKKLWQILTQIEKNLTKIKI